LPIRWGTPGSWSAAHGPNRRRPCVDNRAAVGCTEWIVCAFVTRNPLPGSWRGQRVDIDSNPTLPDNTLGTSPIGGIVREGKFEIRSRATADPFQGMSSPEGSVWRAEFARASLGGGSPTTRGSAKVIRRRGGRGHHPVGKELRSRRRGSAEGSRPDHRQHQEDLGRRPDGDCRGQPDR
jgi:hypothetical protein